MYKNNSSVSGPRCLADLFEKYLQALGHRGFFYRRPLSDGIRYSEAVVGINKIKTFMATICKKAGIEGNFTNHSGKRTCATSLYDAGIDEQEIMARTGHRSERALRQYKRATPAVMARTSAVLDPPECPIKRVKTETETCVKSETETFLKTEAKMKDTESKFDLAIREPLENLTNRGASFNNCVFHFN